MVTEIVPGIYDITVHNHPSGKRYRVYLSLTGTPTLFDTGFTATVDRIYAAINEIGTRPERLVLTHGDGDHAEAFDELTEHYDLETWAPVQSDLPAVGVETTPDHRYGHEDEIGRYVAVHVPGHEPDNHALIDEAAGNAIMGDAISGADQRNLPAGFFHLPPAIYSENLNEAEENLERLLEYDFDAALVYHGSSVTENARENLDGYVNFPGKGESIDP